MASTLADVVAPLTESAFLRIVSDRTLTLQRGSSETRFAALVDWPSVERAMESGALTTSTVRVTNRLTRLPAAFYADGERIQVDKLRRLLDQGASVIVNFLDRVLPELQTLAKDITTRTPERVEISAVLSTGPGGALKPHFDPQDVVVLQIEGTKQWVLHETPIVNPVRRMPKQPPPAWDRLAFDDELRPGDLLFVPAGYWHYCNNGPGRSLHLALELEPLCVQAVVAVLATQMRSVEVHRRPMMRGCEAPALAETERALKASLIEQIERLSLADIVETHQKSWVSSNN